MTYSSPLTLTVLRARIDSELTLSGYFETSTKDTMIADSISQFVRKYEPEDLTASITTGILVGGRTEYAIPDAIDRISVIYDAYSTELAYQTDLIRRVVWFDTPPIFPVTVYGTPNKITTNLSSILAAFDEDYADVIWQYIRANIGKLARDQGWVDELALADKMTTELRQKRNRRRDMAKQSLIFKDRTGNVIDNSSNVDGQMVDISDFGGLSDL